MKTAYLVSVALVLKTGEVDAESILILATDDTPKQTIMDAALERLNYLRVRTVANVGIQTISDKTLRILKEIAIERNV